MTVNGNVAKAGTDIKENDELIIRFGQKLVTVKVTGLRPCYKRKCKRYV